MVFLRIIGLLCLTAFSFSMGQSSPSELNAFGKFISMTFFLVAPALYLLPTFEAWLRKQENLTSISLVNIILGWTLIGWVVAMAWALKRPSVVVAVSRPSLPPPTEQMRRTKACPFCAEEILVAAIKCKHCGSTLESVAATPATAANSTPSAHWASNEPLPQCPPQK